MNHALDFIIFGYSVGKIECMIILMSFFPMDFDSEIIGGSSFQLPIGSRLVKVIVSVINTRKMSLSRFVT